MPSASASFVKSESARLRVGLLVDSLSQPRWIWNILRDIRGSSTSELVAVIIDHVAAHNLARSQQSFAPRRHQLLYSLYSRLDRWLFPTELDPLSLADISRLIAGCTRIGITSPTQAPEDCFDKTDLECIRAQKLDVVLHFGTRTLRSTALGIAKYGVWAYHHGLDHTLPSDPVGFWEVMEPIAVTTSALCVLSEDPETENVIYRSATRTNLRSVRRNRANVLWKAATFTTRKLRDLHEDGEIALQSEVRLNGDRANRSAVVRPLPTNIDMLRLFSALVGRYIASRLRHYIGTEQWFLAYQIENSLAESRAALRAPAQTTSILPPKDRFWADPFPVKKKDGYYVFFEERPSLTMKGFLSVLEIDDFGRVGTPRKVLERDYHLSYPCVFEWERQYFLVPETAGNRTVELYRAVEFPYRWELDRVLIRDVNAVDATISFLRNRWWMFVNIALPGGSSCDELHIYHAETPLGPWLPHRRNPIKSDARNARPAGRIFTHDGEFYRPAQNCSTRYGGSIIINKIVRLDLEGYEETEVASILPDWQPNLVATHTINRVDRLTVMDAKWIRPRWGHQTGSFVG